MSPLVLKLEQVVVQIIPFKLIYAKICGIFVTGIRSRLTQGTLQRPKAVNLLSLKCDLTGHLVNLLRSQYIVWVKGHFINSLTLTKHYSITFCSILKCTSGLIKIYRIFVGI